MPTSSLPVLMVDGAAFTDLSGFYEEFGRSLAPEIFWGRNLDAFNDVLRGGFGTPEGGFVLTWRNSGLSRTRLGYAATISFLEKKLSTCHPLNRPSVRQDLEAAKQGRGPTLFDILVEIIRAHGPGGTEAEDNVIPRLE